MCRRKTHRPVPLRPRARAGARGKNQNRVTVWKHGGEDIFNQLLAAHVRLQLTRSFHPGEGPGFLGGSGVKTRGFSGRGQSAPNLPLFFHMPGQHSAGFNRCPRHGRPDGRAADRDSCCSTAVECAGCCATPPRRPGNAGCCPWRAAPLLPGSRYATSNCSPQNNQPGYFLVGLNQKGVSGSEGLKTLSPMKTPRTAAAPTDCRELPWLLPDLGSRKVAADFSGGTLSSAGGVLLWRQADADLGVTAALAQSFVDQRRQV